MANQEKYAQQMQDAGVCDARGAALCATVKELPDGSFGMVLVGVKGNDLLIYDTIRFTSDGFTYSFKNCRRQAFLDVLQQEISK